MPDIKSLNAEQQKAVEHGEGPLLIIAGAGTGKTTVVTQRVKHLIIDKKIDPTSILALTFTEKAAREMEERVDIADMIKKYVPEFMKSTFYVSGPGAMVDGTQELLQGMELPDDQVIIEKFPGY